MKCFILVLMMLLAMAYANAEPIIEDDANDEAGGKTAEDEDELSDEYFQHKEKRGTFYIRYEKKSKECTFSGYAPNGPIAKIKDIKAPKATLKGRQSIEALLAGAGSKVGKAAGFAMHAIKFSAKIMKAVPMLAPALGVFSAVMGMVNPAPTPQDILNSVNKVVTELTDEVNKKLDQMEGYVDSKVAKAQKKLIEAEYKSAFRQWSQCIEEPTEDLANECQRDAIRDLVASRPKFTPLAGEMGGHVDFEKVRKLEAYMLSFRDYANLVIMELTPILEYYCTYKVNGANSPHYCAQYSDKMKNEAIFFIKYAKEAIAAIKKGHWGTRNRGNCPNTQKVSKTKEVREGNWLGKAHTYDRYKATCEIESSNTKKYCTIQAIIRVDGKRPGSTLTKNYRSIRRGQYSKAIDYFGRNELNILSYNYQKKNHEAMTKYWQQEVLDAIPQWQKAISIAEAMKKKNPNDGHKTGKTSKKCCDCKCDEDVELDQSSFERFHRFQRYQRRLDAAGHQFVDVEALEDQYAEEEEAMKKDELLDDETEEDENESPNVVQFEGYAI